MGNFVTPKRNNALLAGIAILSLSLPAWAKPEYARREGRACQYCHMSGSPGTLDTLTGKRETTERNKRGIYYQAHNHTFEGYVEEAGSKKMVAPSFHYVWKEEVQELPRRLAVADVTGDGTPRLITLNEKPDNKDASTLLVKKWDGKAFVTEFTAEVQSPPDRLAVGKLGGTNKPAVILTPDALWVWNGKTFDRKPTPRPLPILGVTRMKDGSERVLLAESSKNVLAYRINLTSVSNTDWLIDPIAAPTPPDAIWGDMHTTPEFFEAMGVPPLLGSGGILGLWDIKRFNTYFIYHIKVDRDFDVTADPKNPGKPKITYKTASYFVTFRDTRAGNELWSTPKLPGEGYDIALEDPKSGGKPGFVVLFNGTAAGKGRTFAFFSLDQ
jgi:hypothetical protein